jgi:hypothetical protein
MEKHILNSLREWNAPPQPVHAGWKEERPRYDWPLDHPQPQERQQPAASVGSSQSASLWDTLWSSAKDAFVRVAHYAASQLLGGGARAVSVQPGSRERETAAPEVPVPCRVISLAGDEAVCSVLLDGYELPRVGFPARVLRARGLTEGDHFLCVLRDRDHLRPEDVTPQRAPVEGEPEDLKAKVEELYQEMRRDIAENGSDWPVHTAPRK